MFVNVFIFANLEVTFLDDFFDELHLLCIQSSSDLRMNLLYKVIMILAGFLAVVTLSPLCFFTVTQTGSTPPILPYCQHWRCDIESVKIFALFLDPISCTLFSFPRLQSYLKPLCTYLWVCSLLCAWLFVVTYCCQTLALWDKLSCSTVICFSMNDCRRFCLMPIRTVYSG